MKNVTPERQAMLATWQQHTYAEFVSPGCGPPAEKPN